MKRIQIVFFFSLLSTVSIGQFSNIQKLKLGNSSNSQMLPVILDSGIVFMSNHRTAYIKTIVDESKDLPYQLYYSKLDSAKIIGKKNIFSEALSTKLNNGPISFNGKANFAVVSLNQSTQGGNKKNNFLGLYFINKSNGSWSTPSAFKYNSDNYSITHPSLSANGKVLVFSSKEHGEIPNLYYSVHESGEWSKPKLIDGIVNSENHDMFPSFLGNNTLYFSSNRNGRGLDIWKSNYNGEQFLSAEILDSTINTEYDEFGVTLKPDGRSGYFTSNRNGTDAIYYFESELPKFENCKEEQEIFLCYDFEETDIELEVGTPLIFEWDFGDGIKKIGKKTEHCYLSPGSYVAAVSLIDTVSNESFLNISTVPVDIVVENQHSIDVQFLNGSKSEVKFVNGYEWADYKSIENYWSINNKVSFDLDLPLLLNKDSVYTVKSLVLDFDGKPHCVVKRFNNNSVSLVKHVEKSIVEVDKQKNKGYTVKIIQSLHQIAVSDSSFNEINYPIYELFSEIDSIYSYTVGSSEKAASLYFLYQEMKDLGFESEMIALEDEMEFNELKSDGLLVFFGTNSSEISNFNLRNINSFAKKHDLTKRYKIQGYADARGNKESNRKLSLRRAQEVKFKLMQLGFKKSQLDVKVIGEAGTEYANDDTLKSFRRVEVLEY